jgi:hypothetical protein
MAAKPASPAIDRGTRVALVFAIAAESLNAFYEYGRWPGIAGGASLAADWLSRSQRSLPLDARRQLSALGDQLAHQIATTLSREAGLFTAHEMMSALDPRYHSETAITLMAECERLLDADDTAASPPTNRAPDAR